MLTDAFWDSLLTSHSFIPHGHCYLWKPELVWLNVTSDAAIALAYFSIPTVLVMLIRKRKDLPFSWIFGLFGLFIVACGTGHILNIWTLWYPTYWLSTAEKLLTALVSVTTAVVLIPLLPVALALPSPRQLQAANEQLAAEITERKRTEAILKETLAEAQSLNAILDNLADGLLVTDRAGQVVRMNPALATMYGLEVGAWQGWDNVRAVVADLSSLVQQVQAQPDTTVSTEVALAHSRVGQAVASTIFKQMDDQNIYWGSAVLVRDITQEREVDRMKTDFIATVSHELRTPLTSVLGFAAMIKERLDEDIVPALRQADQRLKRAVSKVDANINIIISEAERLTSLINDVLDIAKMEAGRVDWHIEPVSPKEILERAIAATASLFAQGNLQLQQDIPADLPNVEADRDRILQVVINLLSNAVKFTEQGTITCRARLQENHICISIIDTGIGISPNEQAKIFEKFIQSGNTLTDKPRGTGLGLSICQQIIKHHQGNIWVDSTPGQGSNFSFTLPLSQSAPAPSPPRSRQIDLELVTERLQRHITPVLSSLTPEQKTILVVDDDAHIRELLQQRLSTEGYQVCTAHNGMEALSQVKQHKPDLIVLDVMMPQISGFDLAAILKHDPATATIPIIILSILDDQERGLALGVDRYLTKPINTQTFLHEVAILLAQESSPCKVMVVDRNASTLQTVSDALKAQGYHVTAVTSDRECLDTALAEKPDLIILDSVLSPERDLIKALRFEKGMEHVLFMVVGDQAPNHEQLQVANS